MFLWLGPQESEAKEDLEDFVQWRRRQPTTSKQLVSAECQALVTSALEAEDGACRAWQWSSWATWQQKNTFTFSKHGLTTIGKDV